MTRILQLPQVGGSHGRFGNCLLWYALAKSFCEKYEATLQTPDWIGERVFELNDPRMSGQSNVLLSWPLAPDTEPWEGIAELNTREYSFPMEFSNADFRRWLPFRKEFAWFPYVRHVVVHVRKGDFLDQSGSWPIVTTEQCVQAAKAVYLEAEPEVICEDAPHNYMNYGHKLAFLEDFLWLCHAENLFVYPASSFSGCAARFNTGKVWQPMDYHNGPTECRWELRKDV